MIKSAVNAAIRSVGKWEQVWNAFWFKADGRAQLRAFRLLLGLLLFACYAIRSLDLELYYGPKGLMTLEALGDVLPQEFRYSVFQVFPGTAALWAGNWIFLASLLTLTLGLLPRLSAVVALILHVSFIHRNLAVSYGVDTISCFYLLFFCLADFRSDSEYKPGDLQATLGSVAYRLFQIQICVIYGYSGLKKLKGVTWWSGDALWASLAQWQLTRWDFSWMAHFPLVLTGLTFLTLAWEIYFPVLIWIRPVRKPLLLMGLGMHAGIALALNLPFFGLLMAFGYVFFLDRLELRGVESRIRDFVNRFTFSQVRRHISD
jgi:hypothetical protein